MPVQDHIDNSPRYAEFNPVGATTTFPLPFPVYQADDANELKSDFLVVKDGAVVTSYTVTATYIDGVSIDAAIVFSPGITGNLKIYSRRRPRSGADFANGRGVTSEELQGAMNGVLASLRDVYDWMTLLEAGNVLPPGTFVAKAGDTMTGYLGLVGDPVSDLQAATKQYVDGKLPIFAKGDLITHTGAAPAQLVAGTAGKHLVTDPAAANGLRYRRNGGTIQTLASGANIAWDMNAADDAYIVLAHNGAFQTPTGAEVGQTGFLYVEQDGSGNRIPTWDAAFKWANAVVDRPDITAGAVTKYRWRVRAVTPNLEIEIAKDWMSARNGLGFFKEYDLGTVTTDTLFTTAHGLGRHPSSVQLFIECTTANVNWAVGDRYEVTYTAPSDSGGGGNREGTGVITNTTNVFVIVGSGIMLHNKTSFARNSITPANWKLILRIYE